MWTFWWLFAWNEQTKPVGGVLISCPDVCICVFLCVGGCHAEYCDWLPWFTFPQSFLHGNWRHVSSCVGQVSLHVVTQNPHNAPMRESINFWMSCINCGLNDHVFLVNISCQHQPFFLIFFLGPALPQQKCCVNILGYFFDIWISYWILSKVSGACTKDKEH